MLHFVIFNLKTGKEWKAEWKRNLVIAICVALVLAVFILLGGGELFL